MARITANSRIWAFVALSMALAGAGCGGSEKPALIPRADAAYLQTQLDDLNGRVQARDCLKAKRGNIVRLQRRIDGLPDNIDTNVSSALSDSVDNLSDLVNTNCKQRPKPKPKPPLTPVPIAPSPTTTTPSTTTTTPQPTTTTPSTTTPKTTPEENGGDEAPGSSGGNGNGGGPTGGGNGNGGSGNGALQAPSGTVTPPTSGGSSGGAGASP